MPPNEQQDKQTKPSGREPTLDPITLERLSEAIGDLTPILHMVLKELPVRCASLRLAYDTGNSVQVDKHSHFIAGSVANLGATNLTRLARALEEIAKEGNLDTASGPLQQLEQESEHVIRALAALLTTEQRRSHQTTTSR